MGYTSAEVKNRYNKKAYDNINLTVPKGEKDRYKEIAESRGISVNAFIRSCIEKELESKKQD